MKSVKIKKYCSLLILFIIILNIFSTSTIWAEDRAVEQGDVQDKFSYALTKVFDGLKEDEKTPVALWIDDVNMSEAVKYAENKSGVIIDKVLEDVYTSEEIQNYIEAKRAAARKLYINKNSAFADKNLIKEDIIYISEYSPVILVNMTETNAKELSCLSGVMALESYSNNVKSEMNISIPLIEADTIRDDKGYSGSGIKIGMIDSGVPSLNDPALSPIASRIHRNYSNVSVHATTIASIIVGQAVTLDNGVTIEGIVPDAELYCASTYGCTIYESIEWLITNGVNIINASCELGADGMNTYGSVAKWIDHIAVNHDIHFVKSAGNKEATGITSVHADAGLS